MRSKYPVTFTVGIDQELQATLEHAALVTGLSKAEVCRQWLRLGRVTDLTRPGAPRPRPLSACLRQAFDRVSHAAELLSAPDGALGLLSQALDRLSAPDVTPEGGHAHA